MTAAVADEENRRKFLEGLNKLTRETCVEIAGCGCCGSPFLMELSLDEEGPEWRYVETSPNGKVEWSYCEGYEDRMSKPDRQSTLDYRKGGMTIMEELTARNMAAILAGYASDPELNLTTCDFDVLAVIAKRAAVATMDALEDQP